MEHTPSQTLELLLGHLRICAVHAEVRLAGPVAGSVTVRTNSRSVSARVKSTSSAESVRASRTVAVMVMLVMVCLLTGRCFPCNTYSTPLAPAWPRESGSPHDAHKRATLPRVRANHARRPAAVLIRGDSRLRLPVRKRQSGGTQGLLMGQRLACSPGYCARTRRPRGR